jgi:hypothetical protein
VKVLYDQSGNGNDATQTTTANQPKIYYVTYDNKLLRSNQFNTSPWLATNVTITNNATTSPEGVTNAASLTDDATNGRHRIEQSSLAFTYGEIYTLSVFVKKNSANRFLLLNANTAFNARAALNLDTLEITNDGTTDGQVEDYGNGWYRFSVSGQVTVSRASTSIYIQMQDTASDISYVGNGSSFYLYGAQLETGDTATDYVETTTTAAVATTGDVVTNGERPAMQFNGSTDRFPFDSTGLDIGDLSSFLVMKANVTTGTQFPLHLSGTANSKRWYPPYISAGNFNYAYAGQSVAASATANTQNNLHTAIAGTTQGNWQAFLNGNSLGTQTLQTGIDTNFTDGIGALNGANFFNGLMQEIVVYDSDQSDNRTGIETNINDYYTIY